MENTNAFAPNVTNISVTIDSAPDTWGGSTSYGEACTKAAVDAIREALEGEYPGAEINVYAEDGDRGTVSLTTNGHAGSCKHAEDCNSDDDDCECECPRCEQIDESAIEANIEATVGAICDSVNGGDLTPDVDPFEDEVDEDEVA